MAVRRLKVIAQWRSCWIGLRLVKLFDAVLNHGLRVQRTADAASGPVHDVGVDLCGGDVSVTQKLLNGAEVVVVFEKMGGEGVPEGMTGGGLVDFRRVDCFFEGALEGEVPFMVAADEAGAGICGKSGRGKHPEPWPGFSCVGVFGFQGVWEMDAGEILAAIFIEEDPDVIEPKPQWFDQGIRQNGPVVRSQAANKGLNPNRIQAFPFGCGKVAETGAAELYFQSSPQGKSILPQLQPRISFGKTQRLGGASPVLELSCAPAGFGGEQPGYPWIFQGRWILSGG